MFCLFWGVGDAYLIPCMAHIYFLFGRQKESNKEKLSAASASMKGSGGTRASATRTGQCRILAEVRTVLLHVVYFSFCWRERVARDHGDRVVILYRL
jgi:hypothetical protein